MRSDFSLKHVPEEWPITIQKIPCITVGAEYHGSMYQTEWPITIQKIPCMTAWGLSTTVACTRVTDYHPKNAVHNQP